MDERAKTKRAVAESAAKIAASKRAIKRAVETTLVDREKLLRVAQARALMYRVIRDFLDRRGYLEVDTPVLAPRLIPEPTIGAFTTRYEDEFAGSHDLYMIPSPEVYLKRLIASGSASIYEISRCFRNREQTSAYHNPEFSMLEWYSVGADYRQSLELMQELLHELVARFDEVGVLGASAALGAQSVADLLLADPLVLTMREACLRYGGIDLLEVQDCESLARVLAARGAQGVRGACRAGYEDAGCDARAVGGAHEAGEPEAAWDELFQRFFLTYVEPELPGDRPVYITDYPEQIACLAARSSEGPWRERWELYIKGIEVANCYSELVGEADAGYAQELIAHESELVCRMREQGIEGAPLPYQNYAEICAKMPPTSGNALGLDRLLMLLLGESALKGVLLFPNFGIVEA